jgi:filamentous hemagglutinin family protein
MFASKKKMPSHWLNCINSPKIFKSLLIIATVLIGVNYDSKIQAQITPDGSLGSESSVVTPDVEVKGKTVDRIDGGAIRDRNLFHSFSEFNVNESQSVYFANPDNIEQIFTRVTGGDPSNILGTLGVDGAADLLLLNPNGIIFGENSSLDVEGSFFGTTADSVIFEDDTEFSAVNPQSPLLTVGVPLGLQVGTNPGSIIVRSPLAVDNGQNLSFLGGNLQFQGSSTIENNEVVESEIIAPGGRVELGGLSTSGLVSIEENGNLSFPKARARADVNFNNFGIDVSAGGGGSIAINAKNLELFNGGLEAGIDAAVELASGQAGDIIINATDKISLNGSNNSGSIIGNATGDLSLSTSTDIEESQIINTQGNAGNIEIITKTLLAKGLFFIGSLTNGAGNAGNVQITATDSINLLAQEINTSGISSAVGSIGTGNGANIDINTPDLSLSKSIIFTSTLGAGDAGDITVNATDAISINQASQIQAATLSSGNAGKLNINTQKLTITKGSIVDASTFGSGNGGNLAVKADEIQLIGNLEANSPSGITAATFSSGDGGTINIATNNLIIQNIGGIAVASQGEGNAGKIFAQIRNSLKIDGGRISSFSDRSSGGEISISAGNIRLTGNSNILTNVNSGSGGGGNLTLSADSIVTFDDSDILASSRDGVGGNITLDTDAFFAANFDRASLSANPDFLEANNRVDINASGAVDGFVELPNVNFLPNSLIKLSEETINTDEVVANSCVIPNQRQGGTFIVSGNGGLPLRPSDPASSFYSTGDVRPLQSQSTTASNQNTWNPNKPIVEPQGMYRLANGQLVLSRQCN